MKKIFAGIVIGVASLAATACTPTQEGAAIGAGTGALDASSSWRCSSQGMNWVSITVSSSDSWLTEVESWARVSVSPVTSGSFCFHHVSARFQLHGVLRLQLTEDHEGGLLHEVLRLQEVLPTGLLL